MHRRNRPEKRLEESLDADFALAGERLTPDAIAARTERQQKLTEALMQLSEEYRDAIVLKFQDGMSVAQIARLRGESANTVQSRVRRGLAELKRSLQATTDAIDRDDGYEPWLAALVPLAFPAGAPAGLAARLGGASVPAVAAATPSILVSLLAIGLMKKLLLTVAVLVAIGAYLQRSTLTVSPGPPPTVPTALAGDPTVEPLSPAITPAAPLPARETLTVETAVAIDAAEENAAMARTAKDPRISGRVLFVDGRPIPGAEVIVSTEGNPRDPEFGRVTSELDGRFELALEGDSIPETVTLTVDMGWIPSRDAGYLEVSPHAQDVELRVDANVDVTVSLSSRDSFGGSITLYNGARQARLSGEYPGRYEVEAKIDGDIPYGWVLPEPVDDPVEISPPSRQKSSLTPLASG